VGGAFLEEFIYDDEGQLLTGSFMDFLLPTADVVPTMHHEDLMRSPSPLNPLGVKGTGEAGVAGTGAALANAVADALGRGFGDHVNQLPMTPQRVWTWAGLDVATTRSAGAADARTPSRAAVTEDLKCNPHLSNSSHPRRSTKRWACWRNTAWTARSSPAARPWGRS
jgi:hypothetical protein